MKKIIVVSIVLLSAASVAQDAKPVTIPLGTQITARLASQLDSGQVRAGDAVTMDVLEDVKIQNAIVIPKGAIVMGRVNEATGARKMGRGGKLDISFQTVTAADGTKVPVSGDEYAKGKQGYGGGSAAGAGAALLFFPPAGALLLLKHGHASVIAAGTILTLHVTADTLVAGVQSPVTASPVVATVSPVATQRTTEHPIEGYTISGPATATSSAGDDEMSLGEAARQAKLKKRSRPQN